MNKEQIKHWTEVAREIATGQFLFFGGKNFYLYAKEIDFNWGVLMLSALFYFLVHAIINFVLRDVEG